MKNQEIKELKNKPPKELEQMLKESREELRRMRFDLAAGKVKNVSKVRAVRKDIARLMTFLNIAKMAEKKL